MTLSSSSEDNFWRNGPSFRSGSIRLGRRLFLPWLGTLYDVVTFLVAVETSDMTQVLASRAGSVGGSS